MFLSVYLQAVRMAAVGRIATAETFFRTVSGRSGRQGARSCTTTIVSPLDFDIWMDA